MSLIINDVVFLRRPILNYISPPVCESFVSATGFPIVVNAVIHHTAPTGLTANGCSISWDEYNPGILCTTSSCQKPALCYTVYRSDTVDGTYQVIVDCMPETTLDLHPFGNGFYRVSAITLDGESDLSEPVEVTCITLPPSNVVAGDCFLSWDASPTETVTCYNVYRADIGPGPYLLVAECVPSLSLYLGPYGDGFYRVSAVSPAGESELTDPVSAVCVPPCSDDEVDDWVQRILDNGGTVSNTTIEAACEFMTAIKAAGLREKIIRLNLFAGDQFAAAQVPLIIDVGHPIDVSLRQIGNTIVPVGPEAFVYQETGVLGGMRPNLNQSYFNTGVPAEVSPNFIDTNCGLTFYNKTPSLDNATEIGSLSFNTSNQIRLALSTAADSNSYGFAGGDGNSDYARALDPNGIGLYVVTRLANAVTLRKNGIFLANHLGAGPGLPGIAASVLVFAFGNGTGISIQFSNRQSAGYAIHGGFTDPESADWYAAWQAFEIALGRQV